MQTFEAVLLPDDMPHNEELFLPFLRRLSYGTIEIETDMAKADFDNIIDRKKMPKNMVKAFPCCSRFMPIKKRIFNKAVN